MTPCISAPRNIRPPSFPFPPHRVEREGKVQRFMPIPPFDSTLEQPADDPLHQCTA